MVVLPQHKNSNFFYKKLRNSVALVTRKAFHLLKKS
jgi:hypothetical protein